MSAVYFFTPEADDQREEKLRELPEWLRARVRAGGVDVAWDFTCEDSGWALEAHWWSGVGQPLTRDPLEVVIRRSDPTASALSGVNTTVLRRLERRLTAYVSAANSRPGEGVEAEARRFTQAGLERLASGPRQGGDAYYLGLRDLYSEMKARRYSEPLNLLAAVSGVPKSTLTNRLRRADQIAKERADG